MRRQRSPPPELILPQNASLPLNLRLDPSLETGYPSSRENSGELERGPDLQLHLWHGSEVGPGTCHALRRPDSQSLANASHYQAHVQPERSPNSPNLHWSSLPLDLRPDSSLLTTSTSNLSTRHPASPNSCQQRRPRPAKLRKIATVDVSQHIWCMSQPDLAGNRLTGEVNIKFIRALEEQIEEHEKILIELKSARNVLLNISTLPPEVLGKNFSLNATLDYDFGRLGERSHNFLLVCGHWFEVALRTPGVWSFWGTTLVDWARRSRHSGTVPLDLVLSSSGSMVGSFDTALHNTLQDRAAQDMLRRVHLRSMDAAIMDSIISSLTATCEDVRSNSVESLILLNESRGLVDVSDFFAHYRFPELQYLKLTLGARVPGNQ